MGDERIVRRNSGIVWLLVLLVSSMAEPGPNEATAGEVPETEGETASTEVQPALAGRVLGDTGHPVAGATIRLRVYGRDSTSGDREDVKIETIETDEHGRFSTGELIGSEFQVRIEADGYAAWNRYTVMSGELEVRLQRGRMVTGRVLSESTGLGLAGARLSLGDQAAAAFGPEAQRKAIADDEGRYRFDHVPDGKFEVLALADAHAGSWTDGEIRPAEKTAEPVALDDIYLGPGGNLAGLVLDAVDAPVVGAAVRAMPSGFVAGIDRRNIINLRTATDGEGRFAFEGIPAGASYRIRAKSESAADAYAGPYSIEAGTSIDDVEITLTIGGTLTVRLLDPDDRPVTKVKFRFDSEEDRGIGRWSRGAVKTVSKQQVELGEDGLISVVRLVPGVFTLEMEPEDWKTIVREEVWLSEGKTTRLGMLRVEPGGRLAGEVVNSEAEPVPAARITAKWSSRRGRRSRQKETDDDGAFSIGGLGDSPLILTIAATGYTKRIVEEIEPGNTDLRITLRRPGMIRGTVALAEGGLPASFKVRAFPEAAGSGAFEAILAAGGGRLDTARHREIDTDSGSFELRGLAAGRYTVEARAPGRSPGRCQGIEVTTDEATDAGQIVLEPGLSLRGRVVRATDGSGVAHAAVRLERASGFAVRMQPGAVEAGTTSNAEGEFTLDGLEPGRYALTAEHSAFSPAKSSVQLDGEAPAGDVEIRLSVGGQIRGTVRDAAGRPIAQADVALFRQGDIGFDQRVATTGADGVYGFSRVSAGTYAVSLSRGSSRDPMRLNSKIAAVRDDETTIVDFDEGGGIALSGFVRQGGSAVPNAQLLFTADVAREGSPGLQSVGSDDDGQYEIELEHPGSYTVNVFAGTAFAMGMIGSASLHVPDEPVVRLDVLLSGAAISGRIADKEDRPIGGAVVTATALGGTADQTAAMATSLGDGSYAVENLEPGIYVVVAQAEGFLLGSSDAIRVALDSAPARVDLTLERGRTVRGRVVDTAGLPVVGALILISAGGHAGEPGGWFGVSGDGGWFEFPIDEQQLVDFVVSATRLAPAKLPGWTAPDDPAGAGPTIVMTPGGTLRALVSDVDGVPLAGVSVTVAPVDRGPDGPAFTPFGEPPSTDASGTTVVEHLAPGLYEVRASGRLSSQTAAVAVVDGQVAEVRLVLAE
jgi:hypothetical protein